MNKTGSFDDKLYILGAIVLLVVGITAYSIMWEPTYEALDDLNSSAVHTAITHTNPADVNDWLDWMFVFAYFALNILICIVLPLMVEHNPLYIALLFLSSFFYAWIVALLSNVLTDWLTSMGSTMTAMRYVLDNLVAIEIVFMLIMAVIMYYKRQGSTMYYA